MPAGSILVAVVRRVLAGDASRVTILCPDSTIELTYHEVHKCNAVAFSVDCRSGILSRLDAWQLMLCSSPFSGLSHAADQTRSRDAPHPLRHERPAADRLERQAAGRFGQGRIDSRLAVDAERFGRGQHLVGPHAPQDTAGFGRSQTDRRRTAVADDRQRNLGDAVRLQRERADCDSIPNRRKPRSASINCRTERACRWPAATWSSNACRRCKALAATTADEDYPAAATGKDGTVYVVYLAFTRGRDFQGARERPATKESAPVTNLGTPIRMIEQPGDLAYLAQPAGGEQLYLRILRDGRWSEPIAVTDGKHELYRPAVSVAGDGRVWVFYSAHLDADKNLDYGNWELLARSFAADGSDPSEPVNISRTAGTDFMPAAATDSDGHVWVTWVGARGDSFHVFTAHQARRWFFPAATRQPVRGKRMGTGDRSRRQGQPGGRLGHLRQGRLRRLRGDARRRRKTQRAAGRRRFAWRSKCVRRWLTIATGGCGSPTN